MKFIWYYSLESCLPFSNFCFLNASSSRGIEKLAWDASGERLALSFKDGNEMYRGLIVVYDVRRSPLVSLSLV
jgi:hypothetical protein